MIKPITTTRGLVVDPFSLQFHAVKERTHVAPLPTIRKPERKLHLTPPALKQNVLSTCNPALESTRLVRPPERAHRSRGSTTVMACRRGFDPPPCFLSWHARCGRRGGRPAEHRTASRTGRSRTRQSPPPPPHAWPVGQCRLRRARGGVHRNRAHDPCPQTHAEANIRATPLFPYTLPVYARRSL
jgi:hypothetical protein